MNRPILITVGIVIILLILGIWVYLLMFGTPNDTDDVFSNLGFSLPQQDTTVNLPETTDFTPDSTVNTDTSNNPLRQLTTKPVAGSTFTQAASSSYARYMERGTGYISEINLENGAESTVSQTVLPKVASAVFAASGTRVAATSYNNYVSSVFVGDVTENKTLDGIRLEPGARNIAFSDSGDVLYSVAQSGVTRGYIHNLETQTKREIFAFNFINTDVHWGSGYDNTYLSTQPGEDLQGYVYTIDSTTVNPVTPPFYNLVSFISPRHIIATYAQNDTTQSVLIEEDGSQTNLPLLIIPEKCVADTVFDDQLWCAAPLASEESITDWYKGVVSHNDYIWLVDTTQAQATMVANPEDLTGRILDIDQITINEAGDTLLLRNKTDQTLWLLDTNEL